MNHITSLELEILWTKKLNSKGTYKTKPLNYPDFEF